MNPHRNKSGHVLFALLVIAAGALLLSFHAGILPFGVKSIIFSWQMLLIAIGIIMIVQPRNQSSGVILIIIGAVFLLPALPLRIFPFYGSGRALSWAIILTLIGIYLLGKALFGKHRSSCCAHAHIHTHYRHDTTRTSKNELGYIDRNYVFGGGKEKIDTPEFKGGEINCVFGGLELDLSEAQLAEGTHTLELNTVFGGVTLFVPAHWKIDIRPTSVFGSFDDKRIRSYFEPEENKSLILAVTSVFGGGEIRTK